MRLELTTQGTLFSKQFPLIVYGITASFKGISEQLTEIDAKLRGKHKQNMQQELRKYLKQRGERR